MFTKKALQKVFEEDSDEENDQKEMSEQEEDVEDDSNVVRDVKTWKKWHSFLCTILP